MAYDEQLAKRVRQKLQQYSPVEEKPMMGGLCFLYNGKMCTGIFHNKLMCRIDPEMQEDLLSRPGAELMTMGGRSMKGYVLVDPSGMSTEPDLSFWMEQCIAFNPKAKAAKKKK